MVRIRSKNGDATRLDGETGVLLRNGLFVLLRNDEIVPGDCGFRADDDDDIPDLDELIPVTSVEQLGQVTMRRGACLRGSEHAPEFMAQASCGGAGIRLPLEVVRSQVKTGG